MKTEAVLNSFLTGRPHRFDASKRGLRLEGVVIAVEEENGLAKNIIRIQEVMKAN